MDAKADRAALPKSLRRELRLFSAGRQQARSAAGSAGRRFLGSGRKVDDRASRSKEGARSPGRKPAPAGRPVEDSKYGDGRFAKGADQRAVSGSRRRRRVFPRREDRGAEDRSPSRGHQASTTVELG